MTVVTTVVITVVLTTTLRARADLKPEARPILEQAKNLSIAERSASAEKFLKAQPRAKVVAALREGLKSGDGWMTVSAQTASTLHLTELVPELEAANPQHDNWQVILALGALATGSQKSAIAERWLEKISSFEGPARVAIYETLGNWNHALTNAQFEEGLRHESFDVRESVVREFIVTRNQLSNADQIARYRDSFVAKPYQVRVAAMLDFESRSASEQKKLKNVIDESFKAHCKDEKTPEAKAECDKILKAAS